ncbi:MAG: DNA-3-methyladenine glycosylase 2 family protein, partial [Gemmatimonadetes bacterium]|nr:DNA-3-methyladenine glycosylase 2 family protein [Gemmatimonadota bacterium]
LEEAPSPEEAVALAERWRPQRTLAAIYLWAAVAVELPS